MFRLSIISSVILYTFSVFGHADIPCSYEKESACPQGMYCVFVDDPQQAVCRKQYQGELPELFFPFAKTNPVTCWKATDHNTNSSHAWSNARYAVDLHSMKGQESNIFAGLDGEVISIDGCQPREPQCNGAFGNQVKILSSNGIMIFYAHLSEIYVKTGDRVKAGQVIGKEGATGSVGSMWGQPHDFHHLHFSVHYNWNSFAPDFHRNPWPGMSSIPFKLKVCDPTISTFCQPKSMDIRDLNCTKFDNTATPIYGSGL